MKRKVSAVEARQKFGELIERVYYRGDEVVVERAGKPMAAVVPMHIYESYLRQRERLFELVERNWEKNKDVPLEEIEADIAEALREVRAAQKRKASA